MVPEAGLEPAQPKRPGDFKSPVSTNFTTRAAVWRWERRSGRKNTTTLASFAAIEVYSDAKVALHQ